MQLNQSLLHFSARHYAFMPFPTGKREMTNVDILTGDIEASVLLSKPKGLVPKQRTQSEKAFSSIVPVLIGNNKEGELYVIDSNNLPNAFIRSNFDQKLGDRMAHHRTKTYRDIQIVTRTSDPKSINTKIASQFNITA